MKTSQASVSTNEKAKKYDLQNQRKLKVVLLFNELLAYTYTECHQKLMIKDRQMPLIFELLKSRLRTLELTASEKKDSSNETFAINVFKAFFIGEKDLNVEDFDEKEAYLKLILKVLDGDEDMINSSEKKKFLDLIDEAKKYKINNLLTIFSCFTVNNEVCEGYYRVCFYLIFKYMKINSILIDSFITYMKNEMFYFQKELQLIKDYKDEEIAKISKETLVDDLIEIYKRIGNSRNFSSLYMNNNHLEIRKNQDEEYNKSSRKRNKRKKKKNKKNNKGIENRVTEDKNEINENNKTIENSVTEDRKEINGNNIEENTNCVLLKDENSNEEKGKLSEFKEIKIASLKISKDDKEDHLLKETKKADENVIFPLGKELSLEEKLNQLIEIMKIQQLNQNFQKQIIQSLSGELQRQKEKGKYEIESLSRELQRQKEKGKYEIESLSRELQEQKEMVKSLKDEHENAINNHRKEINRINCELIVIKNDLESIRLRDSIKDIIDLFCKALNIDYNYYYHDKIDLIKIKINEMKLDQVLKDQFFKFFDKIMNDLDDSNKSAHTLDLDQDILAQLFLIIDPKDELKILREKLQKGNLEKLLHQLAENRNTNFKNKIEFNNREEIIYNFVTCIADLVKVINNDKNK